jgi:DNA ligase-1
MVAQYPFEKLGEMKNNVKNNNWEGLIMRKDTGYLGKRSKDILKIKQFHTDEFVVLDTENGIIQEKVDGNFQDVVSLKHIVVDVGKGVTTSVGSGFSISERNMYHKHPEKIVGMVVGVQYFEKSQDSGKLRFPTFLVNYGPSRKL